MLRILAVLCVAMPAAAQAFTACDVKQIGGPGASIAEEASNPVVTDGWTYAGFTQKNKAVVVVLSRSGTLLPPVTVSAGVGATRFIRLGAHGTRVYATWQQRVHGVSHQMIAASRDRGATWDAPQDLGLVVGRAIAQMSADSSNVHVAFFVPDSSVSGGRLAVVRSSNNSGRTFGAAVRLGAGSGELVVASHGSKVYASWETGTLTSTRDVMMAVSHDGGQTFKLRDISDNGQRDAREPILSLNQATGRLSLVWREDNPLQAVYLQSNDDGRTWSEPLVVDAPARQVMVQDDGDFIYISYLKLFHINRIVDWQIYLVYSTDGGKTFPSPLNVSGPTGISKLRNDDFRPVPWALNGTVRLTGVEADGVHIWSGYFQQPVFMGPGMLAAPEGNVAVWQAPNGVVDFAICRSAHQGGGEARLAAMR
jgi:hypothetical protein